MVITAVAATAKAQAKSIYETQIRRWRKTHAKTTSILDSAGANQKKAHQQVHLHPLARDIPDNDAKHLCRSPSG
jgi:hypothetical protein